MKSIAQLSKLELDILKKICTHPPLKTEAVNDSRSIDVLFLNGFIHHGGGFVCLTKTGLEDCVRAGLLR